MRHARVTLPLLALLLTSACATTGAGPKSGHAAAETGIASYYAHEHEGRPTASGARYDPDELTAAHRTLPFGTRVRVTNLENDRSVVVVINDRGPFKSGRVIDVSRRAARSLGFLHAGTTRVRLNVVHS